ncbi:thiamine diphosphokinase [Desulfuribacillus alkaliarsenatis]|uniref:Thiamine diphosphokinase n=1 Tax=Desulfuribacillus alkaliarsenatis TaxID=766136 RepID=A0A1E5G5T6_9FIRM|nr:thiamine diphosphokinase [Desulfuribacillus alkaliarsenatis]OEF98541.1 thiamine diphosphokinase [Desulfuribacillus alkaliarsenatis]
MANSNIHVKIVTGYANTQIDKVANDYIIAVDSGISLLRKQLITPDCLVGDLDSAPEEDVMWAVDKGVDIIKFPSEKDQVDTELALEQAYLQQPGEITIYNDLTGRFDQAIALVYLLLKPLKKNIPCRIVGKYNQVCLVDTQITLTKCDAFVSILPFTPTAQATATGLKYQLPAILEADNPIGISNEFIGKEAEIKVKQGIILLVMSKIV